MHREKFFGENLIVMHFNIQGLGNKLDSLSITLDEEQVDILCVSEHWLRKEELNMANIDNFKLITYYARKNMDRGGVCIFARDYINIQPISFSHSREQAFDVCLSKLKDPVAKYFTYIICLYRTGNNFDTFMCM